MIALDRHSSGAVMPKVNIRHEQTVSGGVLMRGRNTTSPGLGNCAIKQTRRSGSPFPILHLIGVDPTIPLDGNPPEAIYQEFPGQCVGVWRGRSVAH